MPDFTPYFKETKGQPIEYGGRVIHLMDRFPIGPRERLRVVRESTKPKWFRTLWKPRWRQGINLKTDEGMEVLGKRHRGIIELWEDTAPPAVEVIAFSKNGSLDVWNAWQT